MFGHLNIAGPKLSEDECGYLRNKKGKFVTKKTVAKSVCSANKLIQARKSVEKRRLDDDAPALAIDDLFAPQKNKTTKCGTYKFITLR